MRAGIGVDFKRRQLRRRAEHLSQDGAAYARSRLQVLLRQGPRRTPIRPKPIRWRPTRCSKRSWTATTTWKTTSISWPNSRTAQRSRPTTPDASSINEKGEEVFGFGKYKGRSRGRGVPQSEPSYYSVDDERRFPALHEKGHHRNPAARLEGEETLDAYVQTDSHNGGMSLHRVDARISVGSAVAEVGDDRLYRRREVLHPHRAARPDALLDRAALRRERADARGVQSDDGRRVESRPERQNSGSRPADATRRSAAHGQTGEETPQKVHSAYGGGARDALRHFEALRHFGRDAAGG